MGKVRVSLTGGNYTDLLIKKPFWVEKNKGNYGGSAHWTILW